jgi:integrase/recombinase XerD
MRGEMVSVTGKAAVLSGDRHGPPALITAAGKAAAFAYAEFFGAEIESPHTYRAYRAAVDRFLTWYDERGIALQHVSPVVVGEYIRKQLVGSKPTKKLHLSALRHFFDQLVLRHVIMLNPAASVRAPKYSVVEGKTPALSVEQARQVLTAIDTSHVVGLCDRAIIAILIYTAARVGAVAKLRLEDYAPDGNQSWFGFDEKGGFVLSLPEAHEARSGDAADVADADHRDLQLDEPLGDIEDLQPLIQHEATNERLPGLIVASGGLPSLFGDLPNGRAIDPIPQWAIGI